MAKPLNVKSFLNYLSRNRLYTAINILGLSVSLMFVILIGIYAYQEYSVDKWNPDKDRIFALGDNDSLGSAYGMPPYLLSRYPEIEKICCTYDEAGFYPVQIRGEKHEADLLFADSTFFDLFPFRIVEGSPDILKTTSEVFISESFAARIFGNENPMGQVITITEKYAVTVGGIVEDISNSIIPYGDIIACTPAVTFINPSIRADFNSFGNIAIFIKEKAGADLRAKIKDMKEYIPSFLSEWARGRGFYSEVTLTSLNDLYLSPMSKSYFTKAGDMSTLLLLMTVALVILVFAVLNYINLTVAQMGFRAKEMATRKLLGASRKEVFLKFILESMVLCAIAFVVGLLFAGALQDEFGSLLQTKIDVWDSLTWQIGGVCVLLVALLGTVAGLIPALHILRYTPIDVVKGAFRLKSKMIFSKVFIVFQNVMTIVLIASSLTIMFQIRHLLSMPLGYNINDILVVDIWGERYRDAAPTLKEEIGRLPMVKDVSLAEGYPLWGGNNNTIDNFGGTGKEFSIQRFTADSAFFRILDIKIKQDNRLGDSDGVWVNERMLNELGVSHDVAEVPFPYKEEYRPVRGIIEDITLWDALDSEERPIFIDIVDKMDYAWDMLVHVEGDHAEAYAAIEKVYEEVMDERMNAVYMEDELTAEYATQYRTAHIVTMFTVIAVIISMLGLVAMSTYFIRQRAGEIAIRRVFGSTGNEIFRRLTFNFLKLVVLAWVIATPVAWWLMSRWLAEFPYRISLTPWVFILAGLLAMLISAVAVGWQSSRAARTNPIDSIKN
jgi:putative ABC transport system permease protein